MNDDPLQNTRNFFVDLWCETTWIVRIGLFSGIAIGFIAGFVIAGSLFLDEAVNSRRSSITISGAILFGCMFLGGFAGLVVGVVIESIVDAIRGPEAKKAKKRRRR